MIRRGRMGLRGDREDGCGRGGLGGGCEGPVDVGAALDGVPLFWWYVPCCAL